MLWPGVFLSVSVFIETAEWIQMVFGAEAILGLSYTEEFGYYQT